MSDLQKQLMNLIAEKMSDTYTKCLKCNSLVKKGIKKCPLCGNNLQ